MKIITWNVRGLGGFANRKLRIWWTKKDPHIYVC